MRRLIALVALAAVAVVSSPALAQEDVGSTIVAVVNKDVITVKQVNERVDAMLKEAGKSIPDSQRAQLRKNMVAEMKRELVEERLLVAEGRRLTESFPAAAKHFDKQIEQRLEQERLDAGGELEFQQKLRSMGQTVSGYSDKLREDFMRREVLAQFVLRDLTASPTEILEYYRAHPERCHAPAQVKYRQIFIRAANFADREKARAQALEITGMLAKHYDFAELARKYSNDGHEANGGLWDFEEQGRRPEPIDKALFSLELGKAGDPIETEAGFAILRVEDRREGRSMQFEEAQPLIERAILAQKRQERYQSLMQRLYEENHVEVVE